MTEQLIEDLKMCAAIEGIYITPMVHKGEYLYMIVADDAEGNFTWDEFMEHYSPHTDWNQFMHLWQIFLELKFESKSASFEEVKWQHEHNWHRLLISHSICYETIDKAFEWLIDGFKKLKK
jgi:hypothetical protein